MDMVEGLYGEALATLDILSQTIVIQLSILMSCEKGLKLGFLHILYVLSCGESSKSIGCFSMAKLVDRSIAQGP